jgi:hypothetical protein
VRHETAHPLPAPFTGHHRRKTTHPICGQIHLSCARPHARLASGPNFWRSPEYARGGGGSASSQADGGDDPAAPGSQRMAKGRVRIYPSHRSNQPRCPRAAAQTIALGVRRHLKAVPTTLVLPPRVGAVTREAPCMPCPGSPAGLSRAREAAEKPPHRPAETWDSQQVAAVWPQSGAVIRSETWQQTWQRKGPISETRCFIGLLSH